MCPSLGEIGTRLLCIADSHQNQYNDGFVVALDYIEDAIHHGISFTLVLLGDMFDMLFGGVPSSISPHEKLIQRLESIAQKRLVLYLEGNHDFNLSPIFEHVRVFSRQAQPIFATVGGVPVSFAHGDIGIKGFYNLYCTIIRNPTLLCFLGSIDVYLRGMIFKQVQRMLQKKTLNKSLTYKNNIFDNKHKFYAKLPCQYIFEGHFHLNDIAIFDELGKTYIALGAFTCIPNAFIVESSEHILSIYSPIA